jgi:hypothetical protein
VAYPRQVSRSALASELIAQISDHFKAVARAPRARR